MSAANIIALSEAKKAETNSKLKHDIMAPICNIKAYTNEVRLLGADIEEFLLQHKDMLPESLSDMLRDITSVEIDICTNAIERATQTLETELQVVFNDRQQP